MCNCEHLEAAAPMGGMEHVRVLVWSLSPQRNTMASRLRTPADTCRLRMRQQRWIERTTELKVHALLVPQQMALPLKTWMLSWTFWTTWRDLQRDVRSYHRSLD